MITYLHKCDSCQHEWEAEYSIKDDPPKICVKCGVENVRRLINHEGGARMELNDNEFKEKLKDEVLKIKQKAAKDENYMANLVGEKKYNQNVANKEKVIKEYGKGVFRRAK